MRRNTNANTEKCSLVYVVRIYIKIAYIACRRPSREKREKRNWPSSSSRSGNRRDFPRALLAVCRGIGVWQIRWREATASFRPWNSRRIDQFPQSGHRRYKTDRLTRNAVNPEERPSVSFQNNSKHSPVQLASLSDLFHTDCSILKSSSTLGM